MSAEATAFQAALAFALRMEGVDTTKGWTGYVNDPDDPGGATNYGIIQSVYSSYRKRKGALERPVRAIELAEVEEIYRRNYWKDAKCDQFAATRPLLALAHFDAAVNLGVGQAARCLQRAVQVAADGAIGPVTLAAIAKVPEKEAVARYLEDRARVYRLIVARTPRSRKFLKGWLARCRWVARACDVPIHTSYAGAE